MVTKMAEQRLLTYSGRSAFMLVILICAGFAGNFFALRLFTGFNYLFGSIAVLLVVRLFGLRWGLLAGAVAASWTISLFGHPYAMAWLCCEPLFVGWLLNKGRTRNIILYDAFYWPLIGAPLIWIFFQYVMHVPVLGTVAAMLMYSVIGITNSLLASILLSCIPWLANYGDSETAHTVPIHHLIFNLMMAIVIIPAVIVMVLHGKDAERRYLHDLSDSLEDSSRTALYEIRLDMQKRMFVLSNLEKRSEALDLSAPGGSFPGLQSEVEMARLKSPGMFLVYIGNAAGRSLAYAPSANVRGESTIGLDFSDRDYFKALLSTRRPYVSDIFVTRGGAVTPSIVLGFPFVSGGGFRGYSVGAVEISFFSDLLVAARTKQHHNITLLDSKNRVIASTSANYAPMQLFDPCPGGTMTKDAETGIYRCMPNRTSPLPLWQRAQRSSFILRAPVGKETPWSIAVETSFAPYQRLLFADHIRSLVVLLILNILALMVSMYTSRRLSAPLRRLSQVTTDLPDRLLRERIGLWPESRIAEIDQLIGNFREMANAISLMFQEITYANETLELRVNGRTKALTKANEELHKEVAERKQTEQQRDHLMEELVAQLRFLQTMIDAIPNPIYFKNANGLYQGCNRAFEESLGASRKEIIGKSVRDLFPPETAEVLRHSYQELLERRGVQIYETQMRYSDGQAHEIIFYNATYDDIHGNPGGVVGTIIDISLRKKAEAERDRLMLELKQKNKELEGIVYVASHDLRSPLVNVQGFSRKLAKNCEELNSILSGSGIAEASLDLARPILMERIPKSLGFITSSIEKMDGLLNGLLRLSRLGRSALCFDTLDMHAILAKIISSMTFQIETTASLVELGDLAPCLGDNVQVTQVFSNLLDNAIKYRSPDRPLFVRVFSEVFPDGVRYCVEDNGMGIPREQQEHVWEIFHRLNPGDSDGEGLGLTLSRRIVDRLGGSIWVESEPGSGSRFYVVLPKPPPLE